MRLPSVGVHDGHECKVVFDHLCCACHGLSVLLTGRRGTETHTVWFDVGPYPQMSACSHAGIVNACRAAQENFPGAPIDLVLGGYHLAGKIMEERIAATVRDLAARIAPRIVAPGHCTGWRAKAALAQAFAPAHYAPSVVGTLYKLTARD